MSAHKEETDMNREQWLDVAVKELTPLLAHAKAPSFKTPLVSVGFPVEAEVVMEKPSDNAGARNALVTKNALTYSCTLN